MCLEPRLTGPQGTMNRGLFPAQQTTMQKDSKEKDWKAVEDGFDAICLSFMEYWLGIESWNVSPAQVLSQRKDSFLTVNQGAASKKISM